MNFLLIEPSQYRNKKNGSKVNPLRLPPIGAAYISAVLSKFGSLKFIDISNSDGFQLKSCFEKSYDFILFSVTSFNYLDACAVVKDFDLSNKGTLVLGGPHTSIEGRDVFTSGPWNMAVLGEGEEVLKKLFENREPADRIPGLITRENPLYLKPDRISRLDLLPLPDYSSFPMDSYSEHVVLTSRGCPFSCSFCAVESIWGNKWYCRDIKSVVAEMEFVAGEYGEKVFQINDDNFTLDRNRVLEFSNLLTKKKMRWVAQGVRADKIDRELLRLMRRAGCERISIGVESADPDVLLSIGKKETVDQIKKAVWMTRDAGIEVLSMFILGTAAETLQSAVKSFDFVKKNTLSPVDFYQLIPYPGTLEWDRIQKQGRFLKNDYREFNHYSNEPVFETPRLSAGGRIDLFMSAQKLGSEMERKWYIKKHLRFFLPHVFFLRGFKDIVSEIKFFFVLPLRIMRRAIRKLLSRNYLRQ